jgi:hypothetical protein
MDCAADLDFLGLLRNPSGINPLTTGFLANLHKRGCQKQVFKIFHIDRLHARGFPLTIRAHRSTGSAPTPTFSANGNTRYEYVSTTTKIVERLRCVRPLS